MIVIPVNYKTPCICLLLLNSVYGFHFNIRFSPIYTAFFATSSSFHEFKTMRSNWRFPVDQKNKLNPCLFHSPEKNSKRFLHKIYFEVMTLMKQPLSSPPVSSCLLQQERVATIRNISMAEILHVLAGVNTLFP